MPLKIPPQKVMAGIIACEKECIDYKKNHPKESFEQFKKFWKQFSKDFKEYKVTDKQIKKMFEDPTETGNCVTECMYRKKLSKRPTKQEKKRAYKFIGDLIKVKSDKPSSKKTKKKKSKQKGGTRHKQDYEKNLGYFGPIMKKNGKLDYDEICHNCSRPAYEISARRFCKVHNKIWDPKTNRCRPKKKKTMRGGKCKRKRVRINPDGEPNQDDIKHNERCEKTMVQDNPWMLEKGGEDYVKGVMGKKGKSVIKSIKKSKKKKKSKSKDRPSPSESATGFSEGTVKTGNDGNQWIITKTKKGIKRWVKYDGDPRGKNKPLEKMWKSLSDGKSVIFIYKNGTHKVIKTKTPHEDSIIQKGNEDKDVKAILTAGNSWDSYRELYSKAKQKSVNEVVKHYKTYFPYSFPDFGYKGFLC